MSELILLGSDGILVRIYVEPDSRVAGQTREVKVGEINQVSCHNKAGSLFMDEPQFIALDGKPLLDKDKNPVIAYLEYTEDVRDVAEDEEWQVVILVGDKSYRDKSESVWSDYAEVCDAFEPAVKQILAELMAAGVKLDVEVSV